MADVFDIDQALVAEVIQEIGGVGAPEAHDSCVLGMDLDALRAEAELDGEEHQDATDDDEDVDDGEPGPFNEDETIAEVNEIDRSTEPAFEPTGSWDRYHRLLPQEVRSLLLTCIRLDFVRDMVLDRVHEEVLLQGVTPDLIDAVTIRDAWRRACSRERLHETRRLIRRVRDEIVRVLHMGSAFQHARFTQMPTFLKAWTPVNGTLRVTEVGNIVPSIGWSALLEATPPQLVRYAYETWLVRRVNSTDPSDLLKRKPHAWDLTAGAGTGHDVLTILGCDVRSSDLTSMNEAVATLDARRFTELFTGTPTYSLEDERQTSTPRPDIVMFDPSSRGTPSNSALYWPDADGNGDARDFAALDRDAWIETTTGLINSVVAFLATGGVVSFLVRHGVRDRGRVQEDAQLLHDVKAALRPEVSVIEEIAIEYGKNRVKQASLGVSRVPSTHLLLGRAP